MWALLLRSFRAGALRRSIRQMGQGESVEGGVSSVPTEVEVGKRRHEYLRRLGIQQDGKPVKVPAATAEAPERLECVLDAPGGDSVGEEFGMDILDLKSQDDFRVNFLRKLSYSKVWVPQALRTPKHQTVIIFDYDDTILCTSYLNLRTDQKVLPPAVQRNLVDISNAAKRLLELAMRLGQTFIITNAMTGWVEYSADRWVPDLVPVLERVKVISARTSYEQHFPGEVSQWKIQAFLEVQRQLNSQIITNLVSLGDSNFEMDAVHVMGKEFAQALVKTIKFRENPSPEELYKQLELVGQKFERIIENARNLKISLERKWVGGPPQHQQQQQQVALPNQT